MSRDNIIPFSLKWQVQFDCLLKSKTRFKYVLTVNNKLIPKSCNLLILLIFFAYPVSRVDYKNQPSLHIGFFCLLRRYATSSIGVYGSSANSPSSNHQLGSISSGFWGITSSPQYSFNTSRLTNFSSTGYYTSFISAKAGATSFITQ